jgi:outer membrane protein OmpA-like peptidoglycan-associated protein
MDCITSSRSCSSVSPVKWNGNTRVFVVATDALRYRRQTDKLIPELSIHKAKMKKIFPHNIRHIPLALGLSVLTFAGAFFVSDGQGMAQTPVYTDRYGNPTVNAQTTVYTDQYGNPMVSVDLGVLEALGPEQNLPDLYRKTAPLPSRPVMARRPIAGGGRGRLLAPPPRDMPRSKLNIPATALPARAPTRQVAPPPPTKLTAAPKARRSRLSAPRVPKSSTPIAAPMRALPAPVAPVSRPVAMPPPRPRLTVPPKTALASPGAQSPKPISAPSVAAPQTPRTAAFATPTPQGPQPTAPVGNISISPDGNLYSIPFGAGSTELPGSATPALRKLAGRMKSDENIRIQLMGFAAGGADSASRARRSSLFRALAIRTYLMKEGVRSTRMDVRALGKTSAQGVTPDRVDIVVQKQ